MLHTVISFILMELYTRSSIHPRRNVFGTRIDDELDADDASSALTLTRQKRGFLIEDVDRAFLSRWSTGSS